MARRMPEGRRADPEPRNRDPEPAIPSPHSAGAERSSAAVLSFLGTVEIAHVKQSLGAMLEADFSEQERAALGGRSVQSVAGFLALKRAVMALARSVGAGSHLSERDVELSHDANGAPVVLSVGAGAGAGILGRLRVSISHTSTTAYGLAVIQEGPYGQQ